MKSGINIKLAYKNNCSICNQDCGNWCSFIQEQIQKKNLDNHFCLRCSTQVFDNKVLCVYCDTMALEQYISKAIQYLKVNLM